MERRLTTILAADVVGYSRLMGADEAGTLVALKAHRADLIEPKAAQYGGRTIKLMGDGSLMEFASVVDAVAFAVEVQTAMRVRNAGLPEDRQIHYRVGINIGDIIVEGDDIYGDGVNIIYGDGVNIAARLEGLAEPGGIGIRRNVRNQIREKLDLTFDDLGEVEVKNIQRPVRAFRVVMDDKTAVLATPVAATAAEKKILPEYCKRSLPHRSAGGEVREEKLWSGITVRASRPFLDDSRVDPHSQPDDRPRILRWQALLCSVDRI